MGELATLRSVKGWVSKINNDYYTKKAELEADPSLESVSYDFKSHDIEDPKVKVKDVRD
jgi:hypothetical protein